MSSEETKTVENNHDAALRIVGRGAVLRLASTVLAAVANVVTVALLVRYLGNSTYGLLAVGISVITMSSGVARAVLGAGAARFISHELATHADQKVASTIRSVYSTGWLAGTISVLFVGGTVWTAARNLGEAAPVVAGLGLFGVALSLTWAASSIARGHERFLLAEVPQLMLALSRVLALGLLAVFDSLTLRSAGLAYLIAALISIAVIVIVSRQLGRDPAEILSLRPRLSIKLMARSVPYAAVAIALILIARLDVLVLGALRGAAVVGRYEPVLTVVTQSMTLVSSALTLTFIPTATRLVATRSSRGEIGLFYRRVSRLSIILSFPVVAALATNAPGLFRFLYGGAFPLDRRVVALLLVGSTVNVILGPNGPTLAALGDTKALRRSAVIGICTAVVAAFILVSQLGAFGAALATAIALTSLNLAASLQLWVTHRIAPVDRTSAWTLLTGVAALLSLWLVVRVNDLALGWGVAATIGIWVLWVAALLGSRTLPKSELQLPFKR